MTIFNISDTQVRLTCERCGIEEVVFRTTLTKRLERNEEYWANCVDCVTRQGRKYSKRSPDCKPHSGELDDDLYPLNKYGKPFRPGVRLCGNTDCINRDHIEGN